MGVVSSRMTGTLLTNTRFCSTMTITKWGTWFEKNTTVVHRSSPVPEFMQRRMHPFHFRTCPILDIWDIFVVCSSELHSINPAESTDGKRPADVCMLWVTKHMIFLPISQFILWLTLHGFLVRRQSFESHLTQLCWNTTKHSAPELCESVEHAVNITQRNYPCLHAEVNTKMSGQKCVCVREREGMKCEGGELGRTSHLKGKVWPEMKWNIHKNPLVPQMQQISQHMFAVRNLLWEQSQNPDCSIQKHRPIQSSLCVMQSLAYRIPKPTRAEDGLARPVHKTNMGCVCRHRKHRA